MGSAPDETAHEENESAQINSTLIPPAPFWSEPFLALRHEGDGPRSRVELGIALAAVDEWFPMRSLVAGTLERAGAAAVDSLDTWSAVLLAEQLELPRVTASDEVSSDRIEIHRPW